MLPLTLIVLNYKAHCGNSGSTNLSGGHLVSCLITCHCTLIAHNINHWLSVPDLITHRRHLAGILRSSVLDKQINKMYSSCLKNSAVDKTKKDFLKVGLFTLFMNVYEKV